MSCQTCKYWKLIGKLEDVYQYKDSNEKLSDNTFTELPPRGSNDDNTYGHCIKYPYASIKSSTSGCTKEESKNQ